MQWCAVWCANRLRLQACRNKKNVPKVKQQSTAITNEIHTNNKAVVLAKTTAFTLVYWGGVVHVPIRTIGGVISGVCTIFGIISSIISGIIGRIGTIFHFFFYVIFYFSIFWCKTSSSNDSITFKKQY